MLVVVWFMGCSGSSDVEPEPVPVGVAVLGAERGLDGVVLETMATSADGLDIPRDLAFNPERPNELWVVNRADDSVTLVYDAGTSKQSTEHLIDPYALHFMEEVSAIAFGAPGTFATAQESRNTYNNAYPPNNFMGPALWSSDLDVFAKSNREAVEFLTEQYGFYTDLGSHLDMLHEDPLTVGIAWESGNAYWVFDGYNETIARNDFMEDHGPGFDDHSDGEIEKYLVGVVSYVEGVPSHLEIDPETAMLYIADTGNNRVIRLDTTSGERGQKLRSTEGYPVHVEMTGEVMNVLVEGGDFGLAAPSGLALHDGMVFVGDNTLGTIVAFDLAGNELDRLETGLPAGALMGLAFDAAGNLWVTDAVDNTVIRISPKP